MFRIHYGLWRGALQNILQLGSGEFIGRLCAIATLALLGHRYGAATVGIFALAQGVAQYIQPLIDFGLRHSGARLVAKYPDAVGQIVQIVQARRRGMLAVAIPLVASYVFFLRLDSKYKLFVFGFATCAALYAFSVDWLAWGRERFRLVGFSRAVVPAAVLVSLVLGWASGHPLTFALGGQAFGHVILVIVAWVWWKGDPQHTKLGASAFSKVEAALRFRRTAVLGFALFSNLAFNTIDVLLLGIFVTPSEVGLYSASYRILNQALLLYYLITQSLYPKFARLTHSERAEALRPSFLTFLFTCGSALSLVIIVCGAEVLRVVFGGAFSGAHPLLSILALAIPMDFLTSYLSSAYVAWGLERQVLICTVTAAVTNIGLNVIFMPIYGAKAAAINTLLSYSVFLSFLLIVRRSATSQMVPEPPILSRMPTV